MFILTTIAIMLIVAITYGSVYHANFVWDDHLDFQDTAWLRYGSDWQQIIFRRFNGWSSYFRPLGVALFTLQVRIFNVQPGPMHVVSLCMHLINTLLVGMLALRICASQRLSINYWVQLALPMLLYGLHPMLIEPVVWIGCQFDLLAVLFMLLGLTVNASSTRTAFRVVGVGLCFFLAAGAKESAVAFPLFLVTFDWFALNAPADTGKIDQIKILLRRNGFVYVSVLAAGIAYLAIRHWALGSLIPGLGDDPLPFLARLQEAAFIYIRYWIMFFWPTADMGPVHPVSQDVFLTLSTHTIVDDVLAIGLIFSSVILTLRRSYTGAVILSMTAALIPVLHVAGLTLDPSLYHERYNMPGLAIACAWLPCILQNFRIPERFARISRLGGYVVALVWLTLSILNVRMIAPLWFNDIRLWQWAEETHADFIDIQDQLISAYMNTHQSAKAWQIINNLTREKIYCMNCMLNAAALAAEENNPVRAQYFLDRIQNDPVLHANANPYRFYLNVRSEVFLLQHNALEAEHAARSAIAVDNLDPTPQFLLAAALILQGRLNDAQQVEDRALQLTAPAQRAWRQESFKNQLKSSHLQTNH